MAYRKIFNNESDKDFIENVVTREEFFNTRLPNRDNFYDVSGIIKQNEIRKLANECRILPKFAMKKILKNGSHINPRSYQLFVKNYMNPNTPWTRLLMKWKTGLGKTPGSLFVAMSFIKQYRARAENGEADVGSVFIIGFTQNIFKRELLKYPEFGFISRTELKRLAELKAAIKNGTKMDYTKLRDFAVKIRKRFSNRKKNGFFKFYGYKEFANRIFMKKNQELDISSMDESEILIGISSGKIQVNDELIDEISNSLVICDEIHNVYNSVDKNNWGIALQTALNRAKNTRALFLSATPLNNNPTEIIDLLNLLLPEEQLLDKHEYFSDIKMGTLKPGALQKIKEKCIGRISFIQDNNPLYFPEKVYEGENIKGICYLKFTRCPMSEYQYVTYNEIFDGVLPQDSMYVIDFALPNPESKSIGLYKPKDLRIIQHADQSWKDSNMIDIQNNVIIGGFMQLKTLRKYSCKYYLMMEKIINKIKTKSGKIFIYHNTVHMSGVLFIQEVLKNNGVIEENDSPSNNTLCVLCGIAMENHKNPDHEFTPARFLIVHSGIEKSQIIKGIERFNNPDNDQGKNILILLGSKLIKESYDLKSVRNLFVMRRPDNISTLIQIIGRAVRQNSHATLPANERKVLINIFTSCLPTKTDNAYDKSYEEIRYGEKVESYKVIQDIERKMHEAAVDTSINSFMFDKKGVFKADDPLGPLKFSPDFSFENLEKRSINPATFEAYYIEEQIEIVISIIKRLFIEQDVAWTYDQLWDSVKTPPKSWQGFIYVNSENIRESSFQIALSRLLWVKPGEYVMPPLSGNDNYDAILEYFSSPDEKIIILPNRKKNVIMNMGKYYCLIPFDNNEPILDIESIYRDIDTNYNCSINIKKYIDNIDHRTTYNKKKLKFKLLYEDAPLEEMEDAICEYGADFHKAFLEELISYIFNILTGYENTKKSEFHDFYFKMLYYYDILGLILWVSNTKSFISDKFKDFVCKNIKHRYSDEEKILKSTINIQSSWCPETIGDNFRSSLITSMKLAESSSRKRPENRVPENMLPIGHFILDIPRFIEPKDDIIQWIDVPGYIDTTAKKWVENPMIIGFDSKSETGVHVRFKIRSPVQVITKYKDSRKIEKGSICTSKSKIFLLALAKDLGIDIERKKNVISICDMIRSKLIYNEIVERNKPDSNIKWFYAYYEKQPEIVDQSAI